jgi:hypothetical protein
LFCSRDWLPVALTACRGSVASIIRSVFSLAALRLRPDVLRECASARPSALVSSCLTMSIFGGSGRFPDDPVRSPGPVYGRVEIKSKGNTVVMKRDSHPVDETRKWGKRESWIGGLRRRTIH